MLNFIVTTIFAIFVLGTLAAIIAFQIRLSKKKNRLPGLVIPVLWFCFTLFVAFGLVYTPGQMRGEATITPAHTHSFETEQLTEEQQQRRAEMEAFRGAIIGENHLIDHGEINFVIERTSLLLLALNIPTVMLLGLYLAYWPSRKKPHTPQLVNA